MDPWDHGPMVIFVLDMLVMLVEEVSCSRQKPFVVKKVSLCLDMWVIVVDKVRLG